jgi:threonylcarbamoyladenosine tRNA methylthiotransferase MtaB
LKVRIEALGCKANQSDAEALAETLSRRGFAIASEGEPCDAVVINTCAVTNESERKSRQLLRRVRAENPGAFVAVAGCYAETDPQAASCGGAADAVYGASKRGSIAELLWEALGMPELVQSAPYEKYSVAKERHRISLKVQDGCAEGCAYCVIPKARGTLYSMPPEDALGKARALAASYKEIVLAGIHLSSYRSQGLDFAGLVRMIGEQSGIERLRIGSLDPMAAEGRLLSQLAETKPFCPHFHLSLQSGSDRILALMNRKYDSERYEKACLRIREAFPQATITTDVIVGFPSESEADFLETLSLVKRVGFAHVHIFPFSAKKGTAAAEYAGQLSAREKRERGRMLNIEAQEAARKVRESFAGQSEAILVEELNSFGRWEGFTKNYLRASFESPENCAGKIVDVVLGKGRGLKTICARLPN